MSAKKRFALDGLVVTLVVGLAGASLVNGIISAEHISELRDELASLRELSHAKPGDEFAALNLQLEQTQSDIDVCHQRLDDYWKALDAVAKTIPGRARAPYVPNRPRPSKQGEEDGSPVPREPGGL